MGKRRKHSKIDQLEPAVKETVDEMIKTGAYYREIVDYIQSHGVSISLAAVGKYAKNLMSTLDALRLSQENFRAIMEETDPISGFGHDRRHSSAAVQSDAGCHQQAAGRTVAGSGF